MSLIEIFLIIQTVALISIGVGTVVFYFKQNKDPEAPSNRGWWKLWRWKRCFSCGCVLLLRRTKKVGGDAPTVRGFKPRWLIANYDEGDKPKEGRKHCAPCAFKLSNIKVKPPENIHGKAVEEAYKIECHVQKSGDMPVLQWSAGKIQCGVFADLVRCLPDDVLYGFAKIELEFPEETEDGPQKPVPYLDDFSKDPLEGYAPITYRNLHDLGTNGEGESSKEETLQ